MTKKDSETSSKKSNQNRQESVSKSDFGNADDSAEDEEEPQSKPTKSSKTKRTEVKSKGDFGDAEDSEDEKATVKSKKLSKSKAR